MRLGAARIVNPCNLQNLLPAAKPSAAAVRCVNSGGRRRNFKITNSWNPKGSIGNSGALVWKARELREKWMEFQGIKNWDGLLDPLDDDLRREILRYGEFVEAAYKCFDFDTSSPGYATCRFPEETMMEDCGLGRSGYKVTKHLHATCGVPPLPAWMGGRAPAWVAAQSSWIGYVAVCEDRDEIQRLGRRDVVIAYRGTATCMEWMENLRATLTCLPEGGAADKSMVQSGFLSLYTSSGGAARQSLRDAVREEIAAVLEKYADEPLSITVTGHSLGAALATLTAHDITASFPHAPLVTVVSFGGPRVGNKNFRRQLEESGTKVLRIVNSDDPITKVPGFVLNDGGGGAAAGEMRVAAGLARWVERMVEETQWAYAEIGEELRLSSRDCPHLSGGGVATCHDLKTYLQLVDSFVSSNCPLRATAERVLAGAPPPENQQQQQQVLCG
ncbi:phospholipase A(1) DAD1, chloroplastic-like [Andrographis paniculata]|uniref:phospholipase A(1) DAD1, chloroplastic-like n=1 Tax=Andrographis paniculata TaxID=175694 RepID=UPI0021E97915|nr:phospholipase A(1) DAD1, chloroplastic-like [Andrographis paniculata]